MDFSSIDFAALRRFLVVTIKSGGATLAVLAAAFVLYLIASKAVWGLARRGYLPERMVRSLRRLLRVVFILLTILALLHVYDVLDNVLATMSAIMALVAIGFVAVWSVLSNTLCSLLLLILRPFRIGDSLRVPPPEDVKGKVVNFNMLYTTLELADGTFAMIPNNMFFQRVTIRTAGKTKIDLDEQLYEEENAQLR